MKQEVVPIQDEPEQKGESARNEVSIAGGDEVEQDDSPIGNV